MPAATIATVLPLTVQTAGVSEEKLTGSPEDARGTYGERRNTEGLAARRSEGNGLTGQRRGGRLREGKACSQTQQPGQYLWQFRGGNEIQ